MSVPAVVMPLPLKMLLALLRAHPALPAVLAGEKTCTTLPDEFPAGCPYLQVIQNPGGYRNVPRRLATTTFDLQVYDPDFFTAADLAATVAGVTLALEGKSTPDGGFTYVEVAEPFPLQDPESQAERWIVTATVTYRPL